MKIEPLNPSHKNAFSQFTEPQFIPCFEGKDPYGINDTLVIALGLFDQEKPIGLALASIYPEVMISVIHTLTHPEELLPTLEKELIKGPVVTFRFSENETVSNSLIKQGWAKPELSLLRYTFDVYKFHPPWEEIPPQYTKAFKQFPWKNLKPTEQRAVEHALYEERIPDSVSPFGLEKADPLNSLGLRHKKEVIGWIITHRIAPDTIKYSQFYLDPTYQFTGYAARLLINSIHKQQESPIQWSLFEINLDEADLSWLNFVEKRLAPYAQSTEKILKSWKNLA